MWCYSNCTHRRQGGVLLIFPSATSTSLDKSSATFIPWDCLDWIEELGNNLIRFTILASIYKFMGEISTTSPLQQADVKKLIPWTFYD